MDYASQQRNPGKHPVGLIVVVVGHVILGYALVNGLGHKIVEVIKAPIETKIIEEVKPPPPPPPENLPPPPKVALPPPSFVPPPEIREVIVSQLQELGVTVPGVEAPANRHRVAPFRQRRTPRRAPDRRHRQDASRRDRRWPKRRHRSAD